MGRFIKHHYVDLSIYQLYSITQYKCDCLMWMYDSGIKSPVSRIYILNVSLLALPSNGSSGMDKLWQKAIIPVLEEGLQEDVIDGI